MHISNNLFIFQLRKNKNVNLFFFLLNYNTCTLASTCTCILYCMMCIVESFIEKLSIYCSLKNFHYIAHIFFDYQYQNIIKCVKRLSLGFIKLLVIKSKSVAVECTFDFLYYKRNLFYYMYNRSIVQWFSLEDILAHLSQRLK